MWSRNTQSKGVSGAASTLCVFPLTISLITGSSLVAVARVEADVACKSSYCEAAKATGASGRSEWSILAAQRLVRHCAIRSGPTELMALTPLRSNTRMTTVNFYRDLPVLESFAEAIETARHAQVPGDWWIVVADVIGSTKAIEAGAYKKVNTVGVACIAAVVNVDRSVEMPFVFGGDGATFAVPDSLRERVIPALREAQRLSRESFDLSLRVGLVQVSSLLDNGLRVRLAKIRLSPNVTQPTFSGTRLGRSRAHGQGPAGPGRAAGPGRRGPVRGQLRGFRMPLAGCAELSGSQACAVGGCGVGATPT